MPPSAGSFSWAARLPREAVGALDPLRLTAGVELLETPGELWLRTAALEKDTLAPLRAVPWSGTFGVLEGGALLPAGHLLPAGTLPDGDWQPLAAALSLALPSPALPIAPPARVPLRLVITDHWTAPNLLITTPAAWHAWVATAAEVRLAKLRFAQTENEVVVSGNPLPALAGGQFVENGGVALPVGMGFEPPVSTATARAALALGAGDFAVWQRHGEIARLPAEAWLPADRAIVRLMHATDVE